MLPQAATLIARLIGAGLAKTQASRVADKAHWAAEQVYNLKKYKKYFDPQGMKNIQRELQDVPIPEVQKFADNELHNAINMATAMFKRGEIG